MLGKNIVMGIGINGFGCIGRLVFCVVWEWLELEFVYINEIKGGMIVVVYLFKFDFVYGRWLLEVEVVGE